MKTKPKKFKDTFLKESGQFGVIRNAERLYRRLINKISAKAYGTTFEDTAAYLASEAYRNFQIHFEISKARALEEARRHGIR